MKPTKARCTEFIYLKGIHMNIFTKQIGAAQKQSINHAAILVMLMLCVFLSATVAIAAEKKDLCKAAEDGDLSTITTLLAKGADVNSKKTNGQTPLMLASLNGHKEIVQLLLENGADVNAETSEKIVIILSLSAGFQGSALIFDIGTNAMHFASTKGHGEIVQLLLAKGADVNARDHIGSTALINATAYGHKEVVELLLASSADVNLKLNNGHTALSLSSRHPEIKELLIKAGAK